MRRRPAALAAVLALALAVPTAHAVEGDEPAAFVPNTPTTQFFMTCGSPSKEYTVGRLVNDDAGTSNWAAEPPASVTTGAGCGKVDDPALNGANGEALYDYTIRGTYTGNLDTLTLTVHTADLGPSRAGEPMNLRVRASVDGKGLFGGEEVRAAGTDEAYFLPKQAAVTVEPVATGATGGVRAVTFTITGIDLMDEADDKRHTVFFGIASALPGPQADMHAWMWGAAEAPSNVVFTPEAPAEATVASIPRDQRK